MIPVRTLELTIIGLNVQRDGALMLEELNPRGSAPREAAGVLVKELTAAVNWMELELGLSNRLLNLSKLKESE